MAGIVLLCGVLMVALAAAVPGQLLPGALPAAQAKSAGAKAKPTPVKPGAAAKAERQTVSAPVLKEQSAVDPGGKAKAKPAKPKSSGGSSKRTPNAEPTGATSAPTPVAAASSSSELTAPAPTAPASTAATPAQGAPTASRRRRAARRAATRRRSARRGSSRGRVSGNRARALTSLEEGPVRPLLSTASPSAVAASRADGQTDAFRASSTVSESQGAPSTVTRTVRDIVKVVPGPLKAALAGLILLSAVLAAGYLFSALRARSLASQRAELLQDVGLLQTALLPPVPAVVGALRTSVAYRPSEGPGAGGDFYDALTLPGGKAAFILGDVCGHGRQALGRTAFVRYTLRAYLEAGLEPCRALQVGGPVIDEHLGGSFATVILAVHDPANGSLTYACAGHPAPIVVGPRHAEPVLAGASPPLGLSLRTGVRQTTVPLPPGSVVCLYTDGLAEARTRDGMLGRARLADMLGELGRGATADGLIERVAGEARLVTDDMATVVLSPTAGVTAGGFREERLEVDLAEVLEGLADQFLEACGVEEPDRAAAVADAQRWATSHAAAVLRVRFGTGGPAAQVLPRSAEGLGAASGARALA